MITVYADFQVIRQVEVRVGMRNQFFEIPLVEGDTGPTLQFICKDTGGTPINLIGKFVKFYFKRTNEFEHVNTNVNCVVTNASGGIAEYSFASGDLTLPGTYFGDLVIEDVNTETASDVVRFAVRENNR